MIGRYLLDTNIAIAVLAGEETLRPKLQLPNELWTTVVVLGELYYGAFQSGRMHRNLRELDRLRSMVGVFECDSDTAREYGDIKAYLTSSGRLIPENDMWIAASARQHEFTLVSRDQHFRYIKDLSFESW